MYQFHETTLLKVAEVPKNKPELEMLEMKHYDIESKGVYVGLVTHALYTISYVF
jgi:hypothetical protein